MIPLVIMFLVFDLNSESEFILIIEMLYTH